MALTNLILGRDVDAESTSSILNLAKVTIVNAASSPTEPVRKQEYDVDVTTIQDRLTTVENSAAHLDAIYVDTTSPDLATAIGLASFADNIWTFPGGIELATGDLLKLNAATNQDSDRLWILKNTLVGTAADFEPLGMDIDGVITTYIDTLKGSVSADFDTLEKIEGKHNALDARVGIAESDIDSAEADILLRPEFKTHTGVFTENSGEYTLDYANPFNSAEVQLSLQYDSGAGVFKYLSLSEVAMDITTTHIILTTTSPSIGAKTIKVLMNGIVNVAI